MKRTLIIFLMLFCFCGTITEHKVTIIEVYEEEAHANDGVVEHDWRTVIELENGSRAYICGKYGKAGDSFILLYDTSRGWLTKK